jgi:hypothetical protein
MHGLKWYPAAYASFLTAALGVVVALNFLSQTTASYVATLGTAVIGLGTVVLARPFDIVALGPALTATLTGIVAFGLKWDDQQIGAVVTFVTLIVGYATHAVATPKAGSPSELDPNLAPTGTPPAAPSVPA